MQGEINFTNGSILKKMLKFMVPILGALVLQAMYGAVDLWAVGKFGTKAGISAVSTGSNIINMVTFTVCGLSMGVTVLIGRYVGEKKEERIGKVIGGAVYFFTVLAILLTIVMMVFARQFAILMKAPTEAIDLTALYVRICGGGIFFIIAYNVISSIFRGMGNSRLPLIFVAIACVTNMVADVIFVAVLKMDVAGAAIATVLAQAVSVILSIVIIYKQQIKLFFFKREDVVFSKEVKIFLRLGAPIALQELLTNLSFLALCAFVNNLGLEASSGYGVAQKITQFVMLIPSSLMQSMSAMVAQNVGAGQEKRSRICMFYGMGVGACIGVLVAFGSYFYGDLLAQIFTSNKDYIDNAASYLKGFCYEAVLTSVLFSFMGYYNGHEQTVFVMAQGLAQTFLVRLPMSYVMSIRSGATLEQIGWAAPTATVFGIMINLVYFYILYRRIKKQMGDII